MKANTKIIIGITLVILAVLGLFITMNIKNGPSVNIPVVKDHFIASWGQL